MHINKVIDQSIDHGRYATHGKGDCNGKGDGSGKGGDSRKGGDIGKPNGNVRNKDSKVDF